MFRRKNKKKEIKGLIGKNCCRVVHNKVIKNEKTAKIYRDMYIYYPE